MIKYVPSDYEMLILLALFVDKGFSVVRTGPSLPNMPPPFQLCIHTNGKLQTVSLDSVDTLTDYGLIQWYLRSLCTARLTKAGTKVLDKWMKARSIKYKAAV